MTQKNNSPLIAKKFTTEKFMALNKMGYHTFPGIWGVYNTEIKKWVTFTKEEIVYTPRGGRKAARIVAETCLAEELQYAEETNGS